jgi:PKHD-type hydroxylase
MTDALADARATLPRKRNWHNFAVLEQAFSPEDCARVLDHRGELTAGTVQQTGDTAGYRDSGVSWITYGPGTAWLFRKLKPILVEANRKCFEFELTGFTEPLQFTEYGSAQHYDWHMDLGKDDLSIRKLSFVVQLTDPAEYDGGALQLSIGPRPQDMPRGLGALTVFPAFVMHRVTPVTRGLRRSLVGWIGGPPFA